MIAAHILGLPVEESALQLAPAGAAMVTIVAIAGRARLGRLRRWLRHRPHHCPRHRASPYARNGHLLARSYRVHRRDLGSARPQHARLGAVMAMFPGVGSWIERRARIAPDHVALVHGTTRRSYAELAERVGRLSSGLRELGVVHGDRVGWLGESHPAFLETLFAAAKLGAVFAPVNHRLRCRRCCRHPRRLRGEARSSSRMPRPRSSFRRVCTWCTFVAGRRPGASRI